MRQEFEDEYILHEKALFLIACAYLGNTEDAKDALLEAALRAYRSFHNLKKREYFKTWITRIVINTCKNFLKQRRYTDELTDSAGAFYSIPSEEIEIMDAVCKMNSKTAIYITLRFYGDMTYDETAKILNQPVSTVKYRTKSALCELKKLLEGDAQL